MLAKHCNTACVVTTKSQCDSHCESLCEEKHRVCPSSPSPVLKQPLVTLPRSRAAETPQQHDPSSCNVQCLLATDGRVPTKRGWTLQGRQQFPTTSCSNQAAPVVHQENCQRLLRAHHPSQETQTRPWREVEGPHYEHRKGALRDHSTRWGP